ncbi:MAG: acetylornithine/succinylornithine family transaminase [Alphaproteobacteria bacterium]|nr:acetylornithine/succinylornithine family transaminase [Alphaproteobacteria bacterium]
MTNAILPVYGPPPVVFERGEGVRVYDDKGKAYLDFIAGIAVNSLGHCHPALVKALTDQANKLWHTSNMFRIPGQERLAQRYCDLTFADRVFFTNSGSEAVDTCLKIARRYQWSQDRKERIGVISFTGSFHGRTFGGINAGGQEKYREGFGPRMEGFRTLEYGDDEAFKTEIAKPDIAAVIIEPVQGEGGVREVPEERLLMIRKLCDENGVLLIYDEVQCGAGRTGQLFHHQWVKGAEPELMACAKGIGGGFPMGMALASEKAASGMVKGVHGSTFGGNPLAMAVGNAVLDVITGKDFLANVRHVAGTLTQGMESLKDRYPELVVAVTGRGLLRGLKMKKDPLPLRGLLAERGLLVGTAGDNVLRLAPPLIVTENDVREAIDIIDQQLSAMMTAAGA